MSEGEHSGRASGHDQMSDWTEPTQLNEMLDVIWSGPALSCRSGDGHRLGAPAADARQIPSLAESARREEGCLLPLVR